MSGETETPKPGDILLDRSEVRVICKPRYALAAAEAVC